MNLPLVQISPREAALEFHEWLTTTTSARGQLRKSNTLTYYESSINQLLTWMDEKNLCLHQLDVRRMRRYFYDREKTDLVSRTTIYHDFVAARKFLGFCRRSRYLDADPLEDIVYRKPKPKPVECPTPDDIEKLLASLQNRWNRNLNPKARYGPQHWRIRIERRDWCMVYAIFLTGARPGEIVKIREEDILNGKTAEPSLRLVDTKGGGDRIVPVTADWIVKLDAYKRSRPREWKGPAVFHGEYGDPVSANWLTRKWKAYAEFAELPHITLKWFRRYRSRLLVRAPGSDLATAADILGNSPKVLRDNYLAKDVGYQREVWMSSIKSDPVFNRQTEKRKARRRLE